MLGVLGVGFRKQKRPSLWLWTFVTEACVLGIELWMQHIVDSLRLGVVP